MNKPIYALSIKQPWAWLICKGFKDIENRDWHIFKVMPLRIYVHAGLKADLYEGLTEWIRERISAAVWENEFQGKTWAKLCTFGAIIGEVTITTCVTKSTSPWFVGKYGFTLADPVLYDKPIPYKGQLGFFKPDISEVSHDS
jgi:hypothetical protein